MVAEPKNGEKETKRPEILSKLNKLYLAECKEKIYNYLSFIYIQAITII